MQTIRREVAISDVNERLKRCESELRQFNVIECPWIIYAFAWCYLETWFPVKNPKRQSALLVQLRTEKIGLRDFLFAQRVPGVTSSHC